MIKTFLGGSLNAGGKTYSLLSTFVKKLAVNFEMILRFFVSGLKRHLAHGQFSLVLQISEPGTFFLKFSGLFGTSSVSKSKPLAVG